jgi:hypothetical protein
MDFFHRIKILNNLRKLIQEETIEQFKTLEDKFGVLKKAGL